ncbi:MAG: D-aminoacylase [Actinomycetia bacterium]|nr:D-aminoacylase [Actinomycetes bacterium]
MTPDLVLRNVRIIDGSGQPASDGDVAITGDRISAVGDIGDVGGPSTKNIDGAGLTLAPGLVDVHTHDDGALLRHPGMEFKLAQGCTSVVIGNCGFSAAPAEPGAYDPTGLLGVTPTWSDLAGFAQAVEEAKPSVNAVALVGHNTIRHLVMGNEQREPTGAELDRMREMVAVAMAQGACGFSTGLIYEPGRYSQTDEIVALASESAAAGGLYTSHIRNEGSHLLDAVTEAITIGRQAGLPVQISHHKAAGRPNWGRVGESLALVDAAVAEGDDITLDVYPYTAGSGPMAQYFDLDKLDRELAEVIRFASCPAFRHYEGRMAVDLAAEQGVDVTEVIRQVLTAPDGDRTICIQFIIDEADIETNLRHPSMMIGSDGIVDLDGRPHPRLFGTFPRVLGLYVRDRKVLSLEEAIRRMTSLSCGRFGLRHRGLITEGHFADLMLFDPDRINDEATYDEPAVEPTGIQTVIVNGKIAVESGIHRPDRNGRFLSYQPDHDGRDPNQMS